jgi:hypothetical protein
MRFRFANRVLLVLSTLIGSVLSTLSSVAVAQTSEHSKTGPGVGVGIGTLGIVAEASFKASPTFVWRLNAGGFALDKSQVESGNTYAVDARLLGAGALADWHPFANGFRLTAGVRYHDLSVKGSISAGNVDINGVTYTAAQYGALTLDYSNGNKVAPYIGLGWDSAHYLQGNLSIGFEIGALYSGDPKLQLSATNAGAVAGLQTNIDAEAADLRKAVDKYGGFWPVIALTMKYRF